MVAASCKRKAFALQGGPHYVLAWYTVVIGGFCISDRPDDLRRDKSHTIAWLIHQYRCVDFVMPKIITASRRDQENHSGRYHCEHKPQQNLPRSANKINSRIWMWPHGVLLVALKSRALLSLERACSVLRVVQSTSRRHPRQSNFDGTCSDCVRLRLSDLAPNRLFLPERLDDRPRELGPSSRVS
jgi:hypothetical protein